MTDTIKGGCLCGAIRYTATGNPGMVGNCYCTDCRKASGTSHCTHVVYPADAVAITGAVKSYERPADSGNLVTRSFCSECGSAICSTNAGMPGMIFLRASSLDDPGAVTPQMSVYASRAPAWAQIDHSKPVFQTMPEGGPASAMKMD